MSPLLQEHTQLDYGAPALAFLTLLSSKRQATRANNLSSVVSPTLLSASLDGWTRFSDED